METSDDTLRSFSSYIGTFLKAYDTDQAGCTCGSRGWQRGSSVANKCDSTTGQEEDVLATVELFEEFKRVGEKF